MSIAEEKKLECIEESESCSGPVEMRNPGYGFRSYARCELHGRHRIEREQAASARYPQHRPSDFDESYAGERWDED